APAPVAPGRVSLLPAGAAWGGVPHRRRRRRLRFGPAAALPVSPPDPRRWKAIPAGAAESDPLPPTPGASAPLGPATSQWPRRPAGYSALPAAPSRPGFALPVSGAGYSSYPAPTSQPLRPVSPRQAPLRAARQPACAPPPATQE